MIYLLFTISTICCQQELEKLFYDYDNEICIDIDSISNLRMADGLVNGKKTTFFIKEIPFSDKEGKRQWLRYGKVWNEFMRLAKDAEQSGFDIIINSSYRTPIHQKMLWRKMPDIAANPWHAGERSHMTGYSVDFDGVYSYVSKKSEKTKWFSKKWCFKYHKGFKCPTKFYWWLRKNAKNYGFKQTVKDEPWHWKFVDSTAD